MAKVNPSLMTAEIDGRLVVFLIGMTINKFWKINKWLPVLFAHGRSWADSGLAGIHTNHIGSA